MENSILEDLFFSFRCEGDTQPDPWRAASFCGQHLFHPA